MESVLYEITLDKNFLRNMYNSDTVCGGDINTRVYLKSLFDAKAVNYSNLRICKSSHQYTLSAFVSRVYHNILPNLFLLNIDLLSSHS